VEGYLVYPWCGKTGETYVLIFGGLVQSFFGVWGPGVVQCGFVRLHSVYSYSTPYTHINIMFIWRLSGRSRLTVFTV